MITARGIFCIVAASLLSALPHELHAQYFGRNKVQYETFDWRVMSTRNFDVHFYVAEPAVIADMAALSERWNARLERVFDHELSENKPIVLYGSHADFQQTNITPGFIGEGTGGFTDAARNRVVMPLTATYGDNDHVLGHELVHVFQYDIAGSGPGNFQGGYMQQLPLWLIEGLAEYLSLGREHPHTAMWLRDDVLREVRPTIEELSGSTRFFPYRYGHALWAYIGGRWGDQAIGRLYKASLELGLDRAVQEVLGVTTEQLSQMWMDATYDLYLPLVRGRTAPRQLGDPVIAREDDPGTMRVSPAVSPDGRYVAYFSGEGLFAVELFIAETRTGRVVRKLASPVGSVHFEAIAFTETAGSWSPDGRRFAFVVFREGDNAIAIVDVGTGDIERTIQPAGVDAIANPVWSPDGTRLAFSGMANGLSNLFTFDLGTGDTRRLTNDRYAVIHPSWSPDGRTIAIATDRGRGTTFDLLTFAPMRLALVDVATGAVRPIELFSGAKHINPQFSPDGRSLYFISNREGFSDIYRLDLATGTPYQITRLATGVTGITDNSAAMSVAMQDGTVLFSVFENSGYNIYALAPAQAQGTAVRADAPGGVALAGVLPPATALGEGLVSQYLRDPRLGFVPPTGFPVSDYDPDLGLEYIGGPTLGVSTNHYGTSIGGGIAAYWRDLLGNRSLGVALQQSGQSLRDFGGQVMFENLRGRWNYGVMAGYVPHLSGGTTVDEIVVDIDGQPVQALDVRQIMRRVYVAQAAALAKYPFSTTRRIEFSAGYTGYRFDNEVDRLIVVGDQVVAREDAELPAPDGLNLFEGTAALVGDWSYFGMTSPIQGARYRFEVAPTFGGLQFVTGLADWRRYFFLEPLTFAIRGIHYGRYGTDAESSELSPLFLGTQGFVRGYGVDSFEPSECTDLPDGMDRCPEFERLIGSRIAFANVELRIPVLGPDVLALIPFRYLPLEVAPFFDAGVAWTSDESPEFRFDRNTIERVPVFSTGVTSRINLLGYAVVELTFARPLQRSQAGWVFEFSLAPGW